MMDISKLGPVQRRDRFLKFIWGREFDYCEILSQLYEVGTLRLADFHQ